MVGNVTIQGQIVGTATFDGAKISAVVTIAQPINATVNFGGGISTIEQLPDPISDSSNIYGWIRSALLTGLSAFTDVTIAATDTILQGFAKLQGQLNAVKVRLGLLENNIIADFVTTSTLTTIDVTGLNFVEGDVFTVECIGTSGVESGNCLLALNNKKVTEYWYNGSTAYPGFLGATGGFYRNVWTVRVNTFNCFCSSDHHRATAAGNAFVMFAVNSQTKPTTIGGLVATPITMISITTNPNGLAAGTRIIVKKRIS